MSWKTENIIGIDDELLHRLTNNSNTSLIENTNDLKAGLNPINLKITSALFIGICLFSLYSFYTFLRMVYPFSVSIIAGTFLAFFIFNLYRLSLVCIISPTKESDIVDSNSIIISLFVKFFFLVIIGSMFSYVTYVILIQKHNMEQFFLRNSQIKPGIISLFSISFNLDRISAIAGFLFFLVLFLLPQLILELKLNKREFKSLKIELDHDKLKKIFEKDSNYKTIQQLKNEWKEQKLSQLNSKSVFGKNSLERNVGLSMYSFLLNKKI